MKEKYTELENLKNVNIQALQKELALQRRKFDDLKSKSSKKRAMMQSLQDKHDEVSKIMVINTQIPGTS